MVILHLVPDIDPATFALIEFVTSVSIKPRSIRLDIACNLSGGLSPAQHNTRLQ